MGECGTDVERSTEGYALKRDPGVLGQTPRTSQVEPRREVGVNRANWFAVQLSFRLASVVLANEAYVDVRSPENPGFIRSREEDAARLFDSAQDELIRPPSNVLRR
jgi:hypothetical protein